MTGSPSIVPVTPERDTYFVLDDLGGRINGNVIPSPVTADGNGFDHFIFFGPRTASRVD